MWKKALGLVLGGVALVLAFSAVQRYRARAAADEAVTAFLQRQQSQRAADEQRSRAQLAAEQAAAPSQHPTHRASDAAANTAPTIVRGLPGDTTATLRWAASTDPRVRGYRVYFGTASGAYAQGRGAGIDAGNATTYQVKPLKAGTTYYFAVTSYDAAGGESDYSSEAAKLIQQASRKRSP